MDILEPTSTIIADLGLKDNGPIHNYFTATCYKYMSKYVPGGTKSHINQNVDLKTDEIIYNSPASHYLYNGKLYVDPKYKKGAFYSQNFGYWSRPGITKIPTNKDLEYHTPGTGAFWDDRMWTADSQDVIEEVQNFFNRR